MIDLPILFQPPMVRAILREIEAPGTGKTNTRRLAWKNGQPTTWMKLYDRWAAGERDVRLWVRETWRAPLGGDCLRPGEIDPGAAIHFEATKEPLYSAMGAVGKVRPSIHMPRWASRITLEVTAVRLQRLQEITPADAIAEGVLPSANSLTIDCDTPDPREEFRDLWDAIHGPGAWEANPEVVAIGFRPHLRNIDEWGAAL